MTSSAVYGSPAVLLELSTHSARLLPRLKLVTQLQDYVAPGSHELSLLSPTLRLWKSFSQGIPLLVLLDLFEQHVVTPDRPSLHHLISGPSYPHFPKEELLSEYSRRVNILNLREQLPETYDLSVRDILNGSGEELLKLVKLSLYIVQVLDTQTPNFYSIPNEAEKHRAKVFAKFLAEEKNYVERLAKMKDQLYDLLLLPTSETIHYRDTLNVQLGNIRGICIYHEYVFHCLRSFLVGGEHWDDLFDVTDKRYARATRSYKYYCDSYLDFRALLSGLKTKDASQSGAEEVLKIIESPISHLTIFSEHLSGLITFSDPREGLYEYDSLCVVLSTWSAWSQNVFEAMKTRRSLHVGDQIKHKAFQWDWEHPSKFGEYLMDDSVLVTISPVGVGTHRKGRFQRSTNTKTKIRCFVFLFKTVLLICRPRDVDDTDTEITQVTYPIPSWDIGPALKSNNIFTVHRDDHGLIDTELITQVNRHTSECTLTITRFVDDFSSETIELHFFGEQQLEQWSNVIQHACPNIELAGFEDSILSLGHQILPVRQKTVGVERDRNRRDNLLTQKRSLDMPNIEPLVAVSRRVKSETHLFVLLELLRPAENRWHELRDRPIPLFNPPQLGHARRRSNGRVVYDRVYQSSKFYWIRSIQTTPLSNAVPDLTGQVVREHQTTTQYGGFATVWKCIWNSQVGVVEVAVKVLNRRFEWQGEEKTKKRLDHELAMWLRLQHDNVVPLLGICKDFDNGPFVSMVSPWYDNGNLHDYIAAHGELSLGKRMSLLSEIAAGLAYLHSEEFVHGDLHSANVLINRHGTACITDFGLSRLMEAEVSYLESIEGGACRWAAPEFRCTFASDIYAYGCIILEVLSGKLPYYNLRNNADVIMELGQKRKPLRPPNDLPYLTDGMWSFANECWDDPPSNRPSASDVRSRMLLLFYRSLASHPI